MHVEEITFVPYIIFHTFFGEAPIDSSRDINEVERFHSGVIFWNGSFIKDEECVAVDASSCGYGQLREADQ